MFKHIFNLLTLSLMITSLVILFLISLVAMLTGGRIILDFNMFNEGWFEVVLLGFFIIPSMIYVMKAEKESTRDYCKRKKGDI